ncbi:MAG: hypothetical protein ACNI27_11035 [Desulfovibrio sp.]
MAAQDLSPQEAIHHLYQVAEMLQTLARLPEDEATSGTAYSMKLASNMVKSCTETLDEATPVGKRSEVQ